MTDSIDPPITADQVRSYLKYVDTTIAQWEAFDPTPRASLPKYKACSVELHALLADMDNRPTPNDTPTLDFGGDSHPSHDRCDRCDAWLEDEGICWGEDCWWR